jgi:RimJ/RimL family protein N-acetyltransferase
MTEVIEMDIQTQADTGSRDDITIKLSDKELYWDTRKKMIESGTVRDLSVENVSLADSFSDSIIAFWNDYLLKLDTSGELKAGIMFLTANQGRFTYYLIKSLEEKQMQNCLLKKLETFFIFTDPSLANIDYCKNNPAWSKCHFYNEMSFLQWDGESQLDIPSEIKSKIENNREIPLIIIADFSFSSMRQDLYYIHYGKFYEVITGDGCVMKDEEYGNSEGSQCVPFILSEILPECNSFQYNYFKYLNETYCWFPTGAMKCIDILKSTFTVELFILTADYGLSSEHEQRMVYNPQIPVDILQPLPVNFHAIKKYVQKKGYKSYFSQQISGGLVTGMILTENNCFNPYLFKRIETNLSENKAEILKFTLNAFINNDSLVGFENAFALLQLSSSDPILLYRLLPSLMSKSSDISFEDRLRLISCLEKTIENFYPGINDEEMCFQLALYAMDLGAWGIAIDLFTLETSLFGNDPSALYNLALCYRQIGEPEKCLDIIEKKLAFAEDTEEYKKLHDDITSMIRQIKSIEWYNQDLFRDRELRLIPVNQLHAEAIWYQLHDLSIGVLTRLPDFQSADEVKVWIDEQLAIENHYLFALIHNRKGFIGCVALDHCGELGHFYFWIGADYQNAGFGTRAAKLILDIASEKLGIKKVFTSVYQDNIRSANVLKKIGFNVLPYRAEVPNEELRFWGLERRSYKNDILSELNKVLEMINSPIVLKKQMEYSKVYQVK